MVGKAAWKTAAIKQEKIWQCWSNSHNAHSYPETHWEHTLFSELSHNKCRCEPAITTQTTEYDI